MNTVAGPAASDSAAADSTEVKSNGASSGGGKPAEMESSEREAVDPKPVDPGRPAATDSTVELPYPFGLVALPGDLTKLQKIVDDVKSRASKCLEWYDVNASKQAVQSRGLRRISVLLVVLGGLCPLIPASLGGALLQPYGYLFLAGAAGVVVFDRAFGYSSSWMRYRIAHMRIARALSLYGAVSATLLAGAETQSANGQNNVRALVAATHTFLATVEDLVVDETESWLQEFKAEHINFQQQFGKRDEPRKPG